MEKQRLNDAVVRLGNLILKGRTFVVHRLSAKIRNFRRKDEKKFQNRIERLLLEIAFMKSLTTSRSRKLVSRKILLTEDNYASKIESDKTTSEERAFYRLCRERCISEYVSKFREDNIDWKYWVPPLLEMWERKQDLKQERSKKKNINRNQKKEGGNSSTKSEMERPSVKKIAEKKLKRKRPSKDSPNEQESEADSKSPIGCEIIDFQNRAKRPLKQAEADSKDKRLTRKAVTSKMTEKKSSTQLDDSSDDEYVNIEGPGVGNLGLAGLGEDQENEYEPSSDEADKKVVLSQKKILRILNSRSSDNKVYGGNADVNGLDGVGEANDENNKNSAHTNLVVLKSFRPCNLKHTGYTDSEDHGGDNSEASGRHRSHKGGGKHEAENSNDHLEVVVNRKINLMRSSIHEQEKQEQVTKRRKDFGREAETQGKPSDAEGERDVGRTDEDSDENKKESVKEFNYDEEEPNEESDQYDEENLRKKTSEDSEDDQDLLRKKQLILEGLNKTDKKEFQIDFSVQDRLHCLIRDMDDPAIRDKAFQKNVQQNKYQQQMQSRKHSDTESDTAGDGCEGLSLNGSSDDNHNSDEDTSFFLKQGRQAKVSSKTIPKKKAPCLSRRERRSHFKKSLCTLNDIQDDNKYIAGHREAFAKGTNFQISLSQQSGKARDKQPFRKYSPNNSRNSRFPVPTRFSREYYGGQQSRSDTAQEAGRFFGRCSNPESQIFIGGNVGFKKSFRNNIEVKKKIHGTACEQLRNNEHPRHESGDRKSLGVFSKNPRTDFYHRKSLGRGGDYNKEFSTGFRRGKGHDWPANQDQGNICRSKGDDNLDYTTIELHKALQTSRDAKRSFNSGDFAGSRASFQKGSQEGDNTQKTSIQKNNLVGKSDKELHPSWAAKKKLSAAINQSFQGKKIVFDDD
ncbi:hypothetical protein BIW11_11444 [Tropilaelaps mercedesae]|uniref:Serum response factor-binding protein 1 n=1 Tax=Tropilaelaps mercedesae TaxID=418985 RepID=A0A1V9XB07_9ACAR|nr:hypothetical protein BIW11_11444 [Tropilaelaps mercedesae]